ncbi:MAG: BlaI/MecI/CopY family transcriptional regulator [Bryobacterales bacterium]|jgi:predicted transcriptional regulator|nr:BlaI/MecI/CopY family transcriptional regulator [Bryobacterales bacterium]
MANLHPKSSSSTAATPELRTTEAELEILQVLWKSGSSTVREVHERLAVQKPTGYTTTLKLMQIMTEKGLLQRDESLRAHVYRPVMPRQEAQRWMLRQLMDRFFDGSGAQVAMGALSERPASTEERKAIRKLIEERRREQ